MTKIHFYGNSWKPVSYGILEFNSLFQEFPGFLPAILISIFSCSEGDAVLMGKQRQLLPSHFFF